MKKILVFSLAVGMLGLAVAPILAASPQEMLKSLQESIKNLQGQLKSQSGENKSDKETANSVVKNLTDAAKFLGLSERNDNGIAKQDLKQHIELTETGNGKVEALIKAGTVSEISSDGTLVKVKIFNLEYKVQVSSDAKVVRNYWGTSQIAEFSVGDIVNIYGTLAPGDPSTIVAQTIRNVSIQKLQASFTGNILTVTPPGTFTMGTEERGTLTVVVASNTKIFFNKDVKSFGDLQAGMKVLVRGIWDRTLSKVQALLVQVRPVITASPTPISSATPTLTPTATVTVSPTPTPSATATPTP